MNIFTSRISSFLFTFIFAASMVPQNSFAQLVKQATSVASWDRGCITIAFVPLPVCGTITDKDNAVDASTATAASISPALAASTAALRVGFAAPIPTGAKVKLLVSFTSGSILSLGLVNNTYISTYTAGGSTAVQTKNMGNLLNLSTLNSSVMPVEFISTGGFQELELRTGSLLAVNVGYAVQLYDVSATYTPLPVELVNFTGKARANSVELDWATASERNSSYFQVERSGGVSDAFQAIGKVTSAGNSSAPIAYHFVDAQPTAQSYYRLRQVDKDGTISYSPVVAVAATPALTWQAYPNPTTGLMTVKGPAGTHFVVINRLGQAVQQGEVSLDQTQKLDLRAQPDGLYFLRDSATGTTVKVVKASDSLLE